MVLAVARERKKLMGIFFLLWLAGAVLIHPALMEAVKKSNRGEFYRWSDSKQFNPLYFSILLAAQWPLTLIAVIIFRQLDILKKREGVENG